MGKDKGAQRTKGNAQASSSSRAADFLAQSTGAFAFGGSFAAPSGPATPAPAAGLSLSAELEVENAVSGELKVTLRKLAKRDAVTRVKASEELRSYLEGAGTDDILVLLPAWVGQNTCITHSEARSDRVGVPDSRRYSPGSLPMSTGGPGSKQLTRTSLWFERHGNILLPI